MRKLTYFAVFEPTDDGYGVYFPDLPGCVSFGKTFEEAQKEATDALGLHIFGLETDNEPVPLPSKSPAIDTETSGGYILTPITAFPDMIANEINNRRVKTNVTIPAWLKEAAEQNNINYSKVLEAALIDCIRQIM